MSPGADAGLVFAAYGGVIIILAFGCSGDVWNIFGTDLEGEEIASTRQFNK